MVDVYELLFVCMCVCACAPMYAEERDQRFAVEILRHLILGTYPISLPVPQPVYCIYVSVYFLCMYLFTSIYIHIIVYRSICLWINPLLDGTLMQPSSHLHEIIL
jgi:hypothetical protein